MQRYEERTPHRRVSQEVIVAPKSQKEDKPEPTLTAAKGPDRQYL